MIEIKLHSGYFVLKLQDKEDTWILEQLQRKFSYNDVEYKYRYVQKVLTGEEPDLDSKEALLDLAFHSEAKYRNYICWKYNKLLNQEGGYERQEHFNFVDGRPFPPNAMWNGYRSALRFSRRTLETKPLWNGFLRDVLKQFEEWEIDLAESVHIDDLRAFKPAEYINPEPVYSHGDITLRDYQKPVIDKIRKDLQDYEGYGDLFGNILLDLAMAFGKSFTLPMITLNFPKLNVISLHNSSVLLSKQAADWRDMGLDFNLYLSKYKNVEDHLRAKGHDYKPKRGLNGKRVISMVQTLATRIKSGKVSEEDVSHFGIIVLDEIDLLATPDLETVMKIFQAGLVLTASGTPFLSWQGESRFRVLAMGGRERIKVTYEEMRDKGNSLPIRYIVNRYKISTAYALSAKLKDLKYNYMMQGNKGRFPDLIKIIENHPDESICVYAGGMELEEIEQLGEAIRKAGYKISVTHGSDPERSTKLLDYEQGRTKRLLSNRIIGVGWSVSHMKILVLYDPTGQRAKISQVAGRVIRLFEGMEEGLIYDWVDDDSGGLGHFYENSIIRQGVIQKELGTSPEQFNL
ncbi:MAG: helicase-related protein [Bacteroidota bacterium]